MPFSAPIDGTPADGIGAGPGPPLSASRHGDEGRPGGKAKGDPEASGPWDDGSTPAYTGSPPTAGTAKIRRRFQTHGAQTRIRPATVVVEPLNLRFDRKAPVWESRTAA